MRSAAWHYNHWWELMWITVAVTRKTATVMGISVAGKAAAVSGISATTVWSAAWHDHYRRIVGRIVRWILRLWIRRLWILRLWIRRLWIRRIIRVRSRIIGWVVRWIRWVGWILRVRRIASQLIYAKNLIRSTMATCLKNRRAFATICLTVWVVNIDAFSAVLQGDLKIVTADILKVESLIIIPVTTILTNLRVIICALRNIEAEAAILRL